MELIYIFIKNYKGIIKNQEYNFGGEFLYKYDGKTLERKDNSNFYQGFFGEKISNITAIVGKNGSGKSSIINFIIDNLSVNDENELILKDEAIIVIKEKDEYKVFAHSNIIIENGKELAILRYSNNETKIKVGNCIDNNFSIVRFSNIFDLNDYSKNVYSKCIDISTNYLLRNIKDINDEEEQNTDISQVELFKINEIYKQIEFVYSNNNINLVEFELPTQIQVSLNKFEYLNYFENLDDYMNEFFQENGIYCDDAIEISENISKYIELNEETENDMFCKQLIILLIENVIFTISSMRGFSIDGKKVDKKKLPLIEKYVAGKLYNIYSEKKLMLKYMNEIFGEIKKELEKERFEDEYGVIDIIDKCESFYNYIKEKCLDYINGDKIILNEKEIIYGLIKSYSAILFLVPILNFKWRDMSSGQLALLSLYSRFYYINRRYEKNNIILIDEGELYFHPEWQKKLINNLANNLPNAMKFKDGMKMQIILTSNSPFLISDLPNNNIIFLDDDNSIREITHNNTPVKTFGANIHELLSNAFFLKNTIGDFALEKIKGVIRDLSNIEKEKVNEERKREIEYIINNIGEPIIQNKLKTLYRQAFPEKIEDYLYKIKELEKEKNKLKLLINQNKDLDLQHLMTLLNSKIEELNKTVNNNDED